MRNQGIKLSKNSDPVSPKIRNAELEIDSAYKNNYLCTLEFAQAAWYLLATAEDFTLAPIVREDKSSIHALTIEADNLLTHIQYPLGWLYKDCRQGGKIPFNNSEITYRAADKLLRMAANYKSFVAAFSYATKRILTLELDGNTIVARHDFFKDTRYEAYTRLIKPSYPRSAFNDEAFEILAQKVKISGYRFKYELTTKMVEAFKSSIRPIYEEAFKLPLDWTFTRYSLKQFLDFATIIGTFALAHWAAHVFAAKMGCPALGYCDALRISSYSELIHDLVHYSGLPPKIVSQIVEDLTYGNRAIRNPDPALQPLIKLTKKDYALSPSIWMSSASERNLTVLFNRLPAEKQIYTQLVNEKENTMRSQITTQLAIKPYRLFNGKIPSDKSLPDIDLAIISDVERVCLILELKWFIDPAEVGEVLAKTEELKKGVLQLNRIRQQLISGSKPMLALLNVDASYNFGFAVVSANWIGFEDAQDPNIAIINQSHLLRKIQHEKKFSPVLEWLNKDAYLPTEGVHYEIVDDIATLANWNLKWYGIKPLIAEEFMPL